MERLPKEIISRCRDGHTAQCSFRHRAGGCYIRRQLAQFEKQLLANLSHGEHLKNISLLPTSGTKFYQYVSGRIQLYSEDFTDEQKEKISSSLKQVIGSSDFRIAETCGEQIEDRGSQITFSALGQQAPLEAKKKRDPDFTKREKIKALLDNLIPEFYVRLGGTTSVDVTKPGHRQSLRD
jgi:phosphomannomutase